MINNNSQIGGGKINLSENDVVNKIIIPLFKDLNLIKNDSDYGLSVPVKMQLGREHFTKQADIVIYREGTPFIVVEAKKKNEKITDDVISQLDSYAMWLPTEFGIATNGIEFVMRKYLSGNKKVYLIKKDIDKLDKSLVLDAIQFDNGNNVSQYSSRLIAAQSESFSSLLKNIHQDIRDIDKLDPLGAFDGWSKLLFMQIHEEKWAHEHGGYSRFSLKKFQEEKKNENAFKYINQMFENTCDAYPKIFGKNKEEIGLSLNAIERILERLDGYHNLNEIPMDVKGKAFEIFLSSTFRGKGLGQYFTPREVVDFMVNIVDITLSTTILDPACGTGGFLIKGYSKIKEKISEAPDYVFNQFGTTKDEYIGKVKDNQIFGIDAEPRAAKTAKMNMIMWGDGENVSRGDGLGTKDITGANYPFVGKKISLILANPPFGNKEKDEDILDKYDLYKKNGIQKTEQLFVEMALKTLDYEGELAIVIPDGMLVCKETKVVREMILSYARIVAVISLPKHTFTPSGVQTISTSVLYVKKYKKEYFNEKMELSNEDLIKDLKKKYGYDSYNIFMGVAREIGYEPSGKATRNGVNDLDLIYKEFITAKRNKFYESYDFKILNNNCLVINVSKISDRMDARFYWFNNILNNKNFEKVELGKYIDVRSKIIHPKTDAPNEQFSIVSVTKQYGVILDESDDRKYEVRGFDISKAKTIKAGDITFNPYRINVGSIGIVGEEYDGFIISPAYVVFRVKNGLNPKTLCALLKNEFYNLYIDIYGLGSIRTSLSASKLKKILIPKFLVEENMDEIMEKFSEIEILKKKISEKEKEMQDRINYLLSN